MDWQYRQRKCAKVRRRCGAQGLCTVAKHLLLVELAVPLDICGGIVDVMCQTSEHREGRYG